MKKLFPVVLAVAGLAVPGSASGQSNGLANLVPDLILRGITLPGGADPGTPHGGHFTLGNPTAEGSQAASLADADTVRAVAAFSDRLRSQFAIFPLGSSTGGFTFSFDEGTGIYTRNRDSFGPAFVERAATIGRKKLSVGLSYQHSRFDEFAGQELGDGTIKFFLPHTDCCSGAVPPPSENIPGMESDILQADLLLNATTDTIAAFVNYGVTDHLDVGVAIPFTRVDLEANLHAHILRLSSVDNSRVHTFVQNEDVSERIFTRTGTATGIADIVLRTKYNFLRGENVDLAAALDLRLPTGDENELLGTGATQAKIFAILSSTRGRVSPHVNLGFTVSGKGPREMLYGFEPLGVSDEFNYAGGVELVAHPRWTILADFLGRTLFDAGSIELESRTFNFRVGAGAGAAVPQQVSSTNPNTGEPYRQLALRSGNLSQMLGATGFKFNASPNMLVMAHVLFPFNDAGLTDRLTLAFGVDYAF
jgi:hypothetical protein